uniref:Uncharacterized protein n=1 Tax=Rhizophora mucronata TaxID=61149 RepID=A0A2P2PZK0_RHIMU
MNCRSGKKESRCGREISTSELWKQENLSLCSIIPSFSFISKLSCFP